MDIELADIFCSAARFRVLKLIALRRTPTYLRQLADLTQMPIRSVEIAVRGLVKLKVLQRMKRGKFVMYSLSPKNPFSDIIIRIYQLVEHSHSENNAVNSGRKGTEVITFLDDSLNLLRKIRK